MMFAISLDNIIEIVLALLCLMIAIPFLIAKVINRMTCKHQVFHENRACDAICRDCGKNLGFIGNLRGQPGKREI